MPAPRYLTSAGLALSERQRWNNQAIEEMRWFTVVQPRSTWVGTVDAMAKELPWLPRWARDTLFATDPEDAEDVVEGMARTFSTAAYNQHALLLLAEHGIGYKQWVTRADARVRATHREANKQRQPLSRPFIVGGQPMQYPADVSTADISLWKDCRCVVVGRKTP